MNHYLGDQIVDKDGNSLFFSTYWNQYLTLNQFCSEHFKCETCLRQNNEIVKGFTRYDSLVLCERHNTEFKPVMKQLIDVLDSVPHTTYTRLI